MATTDDEYEVKSEQKKLERRRDMFNEYSKLFSDGELSEVASEDEEDTYSILSGHDDDAQPASTVNESPVSPASTDDSQVVSDKPASTDDSQVVPDEPARAATQPTLYTIDDNDEFFIRRKRKRLAPERGWRKDSKNDPI